MLLPPVTLGAVYLAYGLGWEGVIHKKPQEVVALILMPAAVAVFAARWAVGRDRFHLVFACASIVLLCREIHFRGTGNGVYVAAALIGVWAFLWRRHLLPALVGRPRGRWLVVTAWSYLLALLIQRRALRFLPLEATLHVRMEEVLENLSHLFLVILGLV